MELCCCSSKRIISEAERNVLVNYLPTFALYTVILHIWVKGQQNGPRWSAATSPIDLNSRQTTFVSAVRVGVSILSLIRVYVDPDHLQVAGCTLSDLSCSNSLGNNFELVQLTKDMELYQLHTKTYLLFHYCLDINIACYLGNQKLTHSALTEAKT